MNRPNERRDGRRIQARFDVRFREEAEAARAFNLYSVNFSAGGLCLRSHTQHTVGELLRLDLTIGEHQFAVDAVVAWVRGDAVGARFVNVPGQVQERLDAVAAMFSAPTVDVDWGTD
jgi:hypothetical protein